MSAKEQLLSEQLIKESLIPELNREFAELRKAADAVFLYSNRQVCALKPVTQSAN